MNIYRHKRNC